MAERLTLPEASNICRNNSLAGRLLSSDLPGYIIRAAHWEAMLNEGAIQEEADIFTIALGAKPRLSNVAYTFSSYGNLGAHVDEVPEDLLPCAFNGMFNAHHLLAGTIRVALVFTSPGYYDFDGITRVPRAGFNADITADLLRGAPVNGYCCDEKVYEGELNVGDRVIFFERTAFSVHGAPNTLHMFYGGSNDRYSTVSRYYT